MGDEDFEAAVQREMERLQAELRAGRNPFEDGAAPADGAAPPLRSAPNGPAPVTMEEAERAVSRALSAGAELTDEDRVSVPSLREAASAPPPPRAAPAAPARPTPLVVPGASTTPARSNARRVQDVIEEARTPPNKGLARQRMLSDLYGRSPLLDEPPPAAADASPRRAPQRGPGSAESTYDKLGFSPAPGPARPSQGAVSSGGESFGRLGFSPDPQRDLAKEKEERSTSAALQRRALEEKIAERRMRKQREREAERLRDEAEMRRIEADRLEEEAAAQKEKEERRRAERAHLDHLLHQQERAALARRRSRREEAPPPGASPAPAAPPPPGSDGAAARQKLLRDVYSSTVLSSPAAAAQPARRAAEEAAAAPSAAALTSPIGYARQRMVADLYGAAATSPNGAAAAAAAAAPAHGRNHFRRGLGYAGHEAEAARLKQARVQKALLDAQVREVEARRRAERAEEERAERLEALRMERFEREEREREERRARAARAAREAAEKEFLEAHERQRAQVMARRPAARSAQGASSPPPRAERPREPREPREAAGGLRALEAAAEPSLACFSELRPVPQEQRDGEGAWQEAQRWESLGADAWEAERGPSSARSSFEPEIGAQRAAGRGQRNDIVEQSLVGESMLMLLDKANLWD